MWRSGRTNKTRCSPHVVTAVCGHHCMIFDPRIAVCSCGQPQPGVNEKFKFEVHGDPLKAFLDIHLFDSDEGEGDRIMAARTCQTDSVGRVLLLSSTSMAMTSWGMSRYVSRTLSRLQNTGLRPEPTPSVPQISKKGTSANCTCISTGGKSSVSERLVLEHLYRDTTKRCRKRVLRAQQCSTDFCTPSQRAETTPRISTCAKHAW